MKLMKTHLAILLYLGCTITFTHAQQFGAEGTHDSVWKAAAIKVIGKYAEWGSEQDDSALNLFAAGILSHWEQTKDERLGDPATAPEAIYAEALQRLQRVQSSGKQAATGDTSKDSIIESLNISLKAAKDERAKLLNYIANLESGAVTAQTAKQEYARGWNDALAAQAQATAAAQQPSPPVISRSLTTPGSLTAPNDFAEHRKAMAAARKGPPMSAADRAALDAVQRQTDQAAHAAEMERQMRNLNTEIRRLGQ
jgi:hypothetical protein